jgi:hypothetical protein
VLVTGGWSYPKDILSDAGLYFMDGKAVPYPTDKGGPAGSPAPGGSPSASGSHAASGSPAPSGSPAAS